ncbi:hypothetical protein CAEBREN_19659 [Caenorhabditis brenneri]|uniref:Uncharacterized protein n=1 Tax=Caenorhabditis brenneri TaxID=135651 RepID=G0MMR5_CAEBE|nr:hypothetical protein CAEBREN_19659 [Caenorhabditis brenneri]
MDPTRGFPFFFPGFDFNNVGLPSDDAQQPGILRTDPLPDFFQLFPQLQGAPNFGSFALNSPGNTSSSNGSVSDLSEQGLVAPDAIPSSSQPNLDLLSSASVPDLYAFFSQLQSSQALLTPQSTGINQNHQEYHPDFHQSNQNNNQLPDFASNPALFPNLSALLSNSPAPFTTQPVQLDFNTMFQGLSQAQTQNVVEHIAAADFSFAVPNPIAQSTQGGPSNRDSHSNSEVLFTMDHILLTKDDQQEPGMRMSSDSSQDDPSRLRSSSARLAINLAEFTHFFPAPVALSSPGNTATYDGSAQDFGGDGLMSPDASSDFSFLTQDTLPSDAIVPDLSVIISQILGSQSLNNNGDSTLPGTQSVGIHQDDQGIFPKIDANYNPMLDAFVPESSFINNEHPAPLTAQPVDMHYQSILNSRPTEPDNNPMLNSASNGALFSDPTLLSTHLLVQNMLTKSSLTPPAFLAAPVDFNTTLTGLWGPLTQKSRKKRSATTTYRHSSSSSSSPLFPPFAKKSRPHVEDEKELRELPAEYVPISPLLKGLEVWTPETAPDYKRTVKRYQGRRTTLTQHVKTFIPPVLTSEEKKRKHAEAVEYVRNCPLYRDPKQNEENDSESIDVIG